MCLETLLHKHKAVIKVPEIVKQTVNRKQLLRKLSLLLLNKQLTHNGCPGHMVLCKITRVISATSNSNGYYYNRRTPIHLNSLLFS